MRLSPFSQPHAAACSRGALGHGLPVARQRATCIPRQQLQPAINSNSRCRLVAPLRCISSGDKEGGSRPKEAGDSPVPRASRQQQAVDHISLLLQEALISQQQTQALVRTLLERQAQAQGQEPAAHQPDQLQTVIEAALAGQHKGLAEALRDLAGALGEQQVRHQEAVGQELRRQADAVRQLVRQQQEQLEAAVQWQQEQLGGTMQQLLETQREWCEEQRVQQEAAMQRQEQLLRQVLAAVQGSAGQSTRGYGRQGAGGTGEAGKGDVLPEEVKAPGGMATAAVMREPQQQQQQELPDLLDYVRVKEKAYWAMQPGTEGVVLGSDHYGLKLKVWSLDDPSRCFWYKQAQLETIPGEESLTVAGRRMQYLPYDPKRKGVPVTRFTAAPGMLVRRGYDVREGEERRAAAGEVGVIQSPYELSDHICLVQWEGGLSWKYDIGTGGRFELVHLEVSPTSGAPVVRDWPLHTGMSKWRGGTMEDVNRPSYLLGPPWGMGGSGGVSVERGTHWTYGGADPGVGAVRPYSAQEQEEQEWREEGLLPVHWPSGQLLPHRASPIDGYDLCYSARPGDPVTLFTARQGLRVELGQGIRGVLVVPLELHDDGVVWRVIADDRPVGPYQRYLVMSKRSERTIRLSVPGGLPLSGTLEFV